MGISRPGELGATACLSDRLTYLGTRLMSGLGENMEQFRAPILLDCRKYVCLL